MLRRALLPTLAAVLALAAPASPGLAADAGPTGIGFAQAEEGTWWCRGDNAVTALNCARDKCRAEGQGQECLRTAWCYPAGWSGLMVVWVGDFHTTKVLCGAPSRAALETALRTFCEASEEASRCDLFTVVGPDGTEAQIDGEGWPGGTGGN